MVKIPIKVKLKIEKQDLIDWIYAQERFQPVTFGYRVDHAEYIEYGTGPQRGRDSYWIGLKGLVALDRWAKVKLEMYEPKERYRFVKQLAYKLGKHGMKPQPYWRPAIYEVMENIQKYYDQGYSLFDMGNEVHRLSDQNIMIKEIPYQGDIQRSWYIDTIPSRDVQSELTNRSFVTSLSGQQWYEA